MISNYFSEYIFDSDENINNLIENYKYCQFILLSPYLIISGITLLFFRFNIITYF
jgi:hypothetical protein